MAMKYTPVLLLTGYLGSGKTTLLNRILNNRKGVRFAVIVNDIGEVNIDADLIQKGGVVGQRDDSLVALQNGCICCTLKMDLVRQLSDIVSMDKFDYIVIEASGICEPAPIAQTICQIPRLLGEEYTADGIARLDCVVTVVDALRLRDEFNGGLDLMNENLDEEDIENLVIQQIEFCNIVLLNKAAEVSGDELGRIRAIVRSLQPKAEIIECNYGDVDLDRILSTGLFDFDSVASSAAWLQEVESRHDDDDQDDDDHDGHHHHHHHDDEGEAEEYGIGTYVYYERRPFDINRFDDFVARKWPKEVIRAKGICYFEDEADLCFLFEQAGRQVSLKNAGQWYATVPNDELAALLEREPALARDWDDKYGDRMQKLVFIGRNLDREKIREALDSCIADTYHW